jgi:hypothetical protein
MIDAMIDVLGIVALALYGLMFLWTMSRVFAIANDTRTMVVLLRRVLDLTTDYGTREREEDDDVDG